MMEKEVGVDMERFMEVLKGAKDKISLLIGDQCVDDFTEKVIKKYKELFAQKKRYRCSLNEYYFNWGVAIVSIYQILKQDEKIEIHQCLDFLYQLTYETTKDLFIDLSFVQMAYYLICNRVFLKQLMLNSLSAFDPTHIEDFLEEYEKDEELEGVMADSGLVEYFKEQGVPELIPLLERVDHIIDEYANETFTAKQKSLTLEDFF